MLSGASTARAATLDDPLRFRLSPSADVAGYVVHVGSVSGFRASGGGTSTDIGHGYALVDGVAQRRLGDLMTASSYVVMQSYDSQGVHSVDSNEKFVSIDGVDPGPGVDDPALPAMLSDDFDGYGAGQDPTGWLDTGANDSLIPDDSLFATSTLDGNGVFETTSTATHIHSHMTAGESAGWTRYELSGRMRISDWLGGIGATIYSDYANADRYFALRRSQSTPTFHLTSHPSNGSASCAGISDTGVSPGPDAWYRFRFQAEDESGSVRLRAKVWSDGAGEPQGWQVDCLASGDVQRAGAPGVWSTGPGAKQWDDLRVVSLDAGPTPDPVPECVIDADCLDGDRCNGDEICIAGTCAPGAALVCSAGDQCNVAVCDAALGCRLVPVANGSPCSDGNACSTDDRCQAGACVAGPAQICPDPGPCRVGYCDGSSGCASTVVADGMVCNDGDPGTQDDSCRAGLCLGMVPIPDPTPDPGPAPDDDATSMLFYDDFEGQPLGQGPADWMSTSARSSMVEAPGLFQVVASEEGGQVLATSSDQPNIHAHYMGGESQSWWDYEYFGRMRFDDARSGVGVTILSDYPDSDSYLRLQRLRNRPSFALAAHPWVWGETCAGTTDSGVMSQPGVWYAFRFRTLDEGGVIRVLAKVWDERIEEPTSWQIDCEWSAWQDASGRPGVWSMGPGRKLWDDLGAFEVGASGSSGKLPDYYEDFEGLDPGSDPADWVDTAGNNKGEEAPELFSVAAAPDGSMSLATDRNDVNIHSHLLTEDSRTWRDYEFSGRMLSSNDFLGMGVTLYSAYPEADQYYRIRRTGRHREFRLANHPRSSAPACVGRTTTGITSVAGVWYSFRFRATNSPGGVRLQAMVWDESTVEPLDWQIDCLVSEPGAPVSGAPGIWSMAKGVRYWDDLRVTPVEP